MVASYCPKCHRVREYGSREPQACARFGTWSSHVSSVLQFGPNIFQDYCCLCLRTFNCKKKFGRIAPYDDFPFDEEACAQCRRPRPAPRRLRRAWSLNLWTPALI